MKKAILLFVFVLCITSLWGQENTPKKEKQTPVVKVFWNTEMVEECHRNCQIISCPETKEAALIDPTRGLPTSIIKKYLEQNKMKLKYIIYPTMHCVHPGAAESLTKGLKNKPEKVGARTGVPGGGGDINREVDNKSKLEVGNLTLQFRIVEHCLVTYTDGYIFIGDRTGPFDVPDRDSLQRLLKSIEKQVKNLDDNWIVYPSNTTAVTIGYLKANKYKLPKTTKPKIGIKISTEGECVKISDVNETAKKVGIEKGDFLVEFNGLPIKDKKGFNMAVEQIVFGRKYVLKIKRGNEEKIVELEARPR
jgi:glyoxylase-like metal-dependent hydrolase (beta-lactamase superfamily II)